MTLKHNQQLPNNHFRKDWQRRVRVHFDQPGKKKTRRNARAEKAVKLAPRPVDKLRPVVRCPTVKYNRRVRAGRGFSLAELKEAGIARKLAPTIGISVDPRRQNLSSESLTANVERLKAYKARLVLFPKKAKSPKSGDSEKSAIEGVKDKAITQNKATFPISNKVVIQEGKVADYEASENAYKTLRAARSDARLVGKREKRAKAKEDEKESAKK
ncbi:60S ribosomal protein L13 [Elasticomyces elasticus]|nr:60S ribosomal protein L13 [Elasticomyces elasticus]KAK3642129.1 60S ribosomal protein L13 [Elasticomyces elasticus]KAK4914177.1 60S ribosomal protein L13 [Elasticomyces elasticus]KAK5732301.1 60S ribosomal protein L13 [Elasticomyces elasticus]KAK5762538.1 60S ribosomal protein L13 [Elasticomyces elasticus]